MTQTVFFRKIKFSISQFKLTTSLGEVFITQPGSQNYLIKIDSTFKAIFSKKKFKSVLGKVLELDIK